jgi:hypothetical protein
MVCCFDWKKSRNDWRISVLVIGKAWPQRGAKVSKRNWQGRIASPPTISASEAHKNQGRGGTRPCQKQGGRIQKESGKASGSFPPAARRAQPGAAHEAGLCRKHSSFATVSLDELLAAME